MTDEVFGRTIQLFLVDGSPSGLRKATIHGWTGVVFVASGATFGAMVSRAEVQRTGVYILAGPDPEAIGGMRAYIGSANDVRERIKQSAQQRSFWEIAVAVTTSDDDLSKGHVEYLEARLIEMAYAARRMSLDNATSPTGQRRRLPEADQANMEQFLLNLKIVLPVIGLDLLKPQPRAVSEITSSVETRTLGEVKFEIRHKSGVHAHAVEEDGEFVVLEGSQALKDQGHVSNSYADLKESLVKAGILVDVDDQRYSFAQPYSFKSPSAAAAVILDRNSNGRTEWKVEGSPQTYQDWHQAQLMT
jgi:hypothetical protein